MDIKGKSGIINTGNTCYLNSAIQAISHTNLLREYLFTNKEKIINILIKNAPKIYRDKKHIPPQLNEYLQSKDYNSNNLNDNVKEYLVNGTVTFALIKLLEGLWDRNVVVLPTTFKQIFLQRSKFNGYVQQDSQEAYSCILQAIEEELSVDRDIVEMMNDLQIQEKIFIDKMAKTNDNNVKEKLSRDLFIFKKNNPIQSLMTDYHNAKKKCNSSIINDLFTGFFISTLECTECGYMSNAFDSFSLISLDLPNDPDINLTDCLDNYCAESVLDKDNLWKCENCKNNVCAKKRMNIWNAPKILVIQLNRSRYGSNKKDNRLVEFPFLDFDISDNISKMNTENINTKYNLYSVVNHVGNAQYGHYFTFCRDKTSELWFMFDDQNVRRIINPDKRIITSDAYLLFYERE